MAAVESVVEQDTTVPSEKSDLATSLKKANADLRTANGDTSANGEDGHPSYQGVANPGANLSAQPGNANGAETSAASEAAAAFDAYDGMSNDEKRKQCVQVMNQALEKITIHQILELRQCQTAPSPETEGLVLALMKLLTKIDDTVEGPVGSWAEACKIFHKPGHFINSLRRYQYACDAGRVQHENRSQLPALSTFPESVKEKCGLAGHLRTWLLGAVGYFDASSKPSSSGKAEKQATSSSDGGKISRPKSAGVAASASTTGPAVSSMMSSRLKPKTSLPAAKSGPRGEETQSDAASASDTSRRPVRTAASSLGGMSKTTSHFPTSSNVGASVEKKKTFASPVSNNPKLMNLDDINAIMEQTRKEVRELKSMEAKSRWEMTREEKRDVQQKHKTSENELREWRWKQQDDMRELVNQIKKDTQMKELSDNKEFQEHKRDTKRLEKEEDLKRIESAYTDLKKNSKWDAELKKNLALERNELIHSHLDQYNHDREANRALEDQYKQEQADRRALEIHSKAVLTQKKLLAEKEQLLQSLKFVRDRQEAPLNRR